MVVVFSCNSTRINTGVARFLMVFVQSFGGWPFEDPLLYRIILCKERYCIQYKSHEFIKLDKCQVYGSLDRKSWKLRRSFKNFFLCKNVRHLSSLKFRFCNDVVVIGALSAGSRNSDVFINLQPLLHVLGVHIALQVHLKLNLEIIEGLNGLKSKLYPAHNL